MRWPSRPRLLISYAYIKGDVSGDLVGVDLLIDSGAFTAYTLGKSIDLQAYTAYLQKNAKNITAAFALDVIGDHEASLRNYRQQKAALGKSVELIPTWHVTSPLDNLRELCEEADYVAVGGAVGYSTQQRALMRTLVQAHKIAREHGTRLHGLGMTSNQTRRLPWYSVDSSSWIYPMKYPMLLLATKDGSIRSLKRGQKSIHSEKDLVTAYGLPLNRLAIPGESTKDNCGQEEATRRVESYSLAAARGYYYSEATNKHKTRVYLAGERMNARLIKQAWAAGPPRFRHAHI